MTTDASARNTSVLATRKVLAMTENVSLLPFPNVTSQTWTTHDILDANTTGSAWGGSAASFTVISMLGSA